MLLRYAAVAQIPQMNFDLSPTNLGKYLMTYEDRKRQKNPHKEKDDWLNADTDKWAYLTIGVTSHHHRGAVSSNRLSALIIQMVGPLSCTSICFFFAYRFIPIALT